MKSTSVISLNAVANPVVMAIPYLYCLIAAIYFERASLPLVIVGGAFLGLGSAGFYMLWQRLFASFDSDRGNLDLIRGTVYGAIMYFGLYRVAFPFVIASFLLLPFSSLEYARWQAAILYAVYSVVIMLMMIQCAQASRDRGINPVFIYGFFGGIVYTLHDVGFLAGTFSEQVRIWGIDPLATTALVSLYLLGFMFFIGQGGFKRVLRHDPSAENIELIMLDGRPPARIAKSTASQLTADDERTDRAAGAPEGDFPAEPPTAFPKKPAIAAEYTRSEGEVDRHDSGQPDGSGRGAGSRSDDPASQADIPRGRGRRNFEGDFELTDRLSKQAQVLREQYRLSARETEVMEYIARVHRRAHRRGAHRVGEHHPHAQQVHLREARRAQKARAHRHAQSRRAVGSRIPRGERFPTASLSHRPIGRARSDRPHTSRAHRRAP